MKLLKIFSIVFSFCLFVPLSAQVPSLKELQDAAEQKSKSILSGKLVFVEEEVYKDTLLPRESRETTIFFCNKEKESNSSKKGANVKCMNIFYPKSSVRHLYDGSFHTRIDHKRKEIRRDTIPIQGILRFLFYPEMLTFYRIPISPLLNWKVKGKVLETETSFLITFEHKGAIPDMSPKYQRKQDKKEATYKRKNDANRFNLSSMAGATYLTTFELRKSDSLLISQTTVVADTRPYTRDAIIGKRIRILESAINEEKYFSPQYYSSETYADTNYMVTKTLTAKEKKAALDATRYMQAPDFKCFSMQKGDTIALADYKGKWVLLDFFIMGYAPSMRMVSEMNEIQKQYDANELQVLGLTMHRNSESLANFVQQKELLYPVLSIRGTDIAASYKINSFPAVIVIAPDQTIAYIGTGDECALTLKEFLQNNLK